MLERKPLRAEIVKGLKGTGISLCAAAGFGLGAFSSGASNDPNVDDINAAITYGIGSTGLMASGAAAGGLAALPYAFGWAAGYVTCEYLECAADRPPPVDPPTATP